MASNEAIDQQTLQTVVARAKTLIAASLKEICRQENLPVSGVKGTLQQRILERESDILSTTAADRSFHSSLVDWVTADMDVSERIAKLCHHRKCRCLQSPEGLDQRPER